MYYWSPAKRKNHFEQAVVFFSSILYLAHITNDSPVLMLGVLIAIGALLIPFHHRLEKWITKIMVEKNKKIRLDAAKKTIAQLEAPNGANLEGKLFNQIII